MAVADPARGGGNPGTAKGRATRARIVRVAAALMYERGVANTSTEDIRDAAGVSNSQLYHYFAGKHDLTHAVIDHQIEQVLAAQQSLLAQLDSLEALRAWRDVLVELVTQRAGQGGCPMASLANELADLDEHARIALAAGFTRWETALSNALAVMRERGVLRADAEPEHLARAVLTAVQGGLLLSHTRRDSSALEAGLDAAIGYIATFATTGRHPETRRRSTGLPPQVGARGASDTCQDPDVNEVGPGLDWRVGYVVKRLQQALRAATDAALRDHGLTTPQYAALAVLADQPGLSNSELARRGFVTRQTMNDILAGLEGAGLVCRQQHPLDRRVQLARLTAAGRDLVAAADQSVSEVERRMPGDLSPAHRGSLLDVLRSCAENLESATGHLAPSRPAGAARNLCPPR